MGTDAADTAKVVARRIGQRIQAYQSDVTDRQYITNMINQIAEEFGHGYVDIVVANAGVCAHVPSLDYCEESQ